MRFSGEAVLQCLPGRVEFEDHRSVVKNHVRPFEQQDNSLQDYIEASLKLQFNKH